MSIRIHLRIYFRSFIVITIASGLSIVAWVMLYKFFTIRHIEVRGVDAQLFIETDKFPQNLLFFPTESIQRDILTNNYLIRSVRLTKKFPHTLVIDVTLRIPIAMIRWRDSMYTVDREGVIMGLRTQEDQLPNIIFPTERIIPGTKLYDGKLQSALVFLDAIRDRFRIEYIDEYESQSFQAVSEQIDIIIPQLTDYSAIAATLQTLIGGFRIKGTLPKRIDLRFDKPVVTF